MPCLIKPIISFDSLTNEIEVTNPQTGYTYEVVVKDTTSTCPDDWGFAPSVASDKFDVSALTPGTYVALAITKTNGTGGGTLPPSYDIATRGGSITFSIGPVS